MLAGRQRHLIRIVDLQERERDLGSGMSPAAELIEELDCAGHTVLAAGIETADVLWRTSLDHDELVVLCLSRRRQQKCGEK